VTVMSGPHGAPEWSAEREAQVLGLFRDRRYRLRFLASSRCPADGGLLGASCELPDGLWIWIAGSRMSPSASLDAFRVIALVSLKGTRPSDRPAILRALAPLSHHRDQRNARLPGARSRRAIQ
jgi:hypothetical protein